MDGLEDKLNAILSDPEAMGKISEMAKSLFSGEENAGDGRPDDGDESLIRRAGQLLRRDALRPDETALLTALRPFLSEERRARLDRAIKIARLTSLARLAGEFADIGGDG